MWARAKVIGLVLIVAWAIVPFNGYSEDYPNTSIDESFNIFLLSLSDRDSISLLQDFNIQILEDYNNGYYLAGGSTYANKFLEKFGINIRMIPDRTTLKFPAAGYTFDTMIGPPSMPQQLTSTNTDEKIVQFVGPIKSEWTEFINSMGVKFERYVESFAFVAKMNDVQIEDVMALPFVNWIGTYEPAYKVQSELFAMKGIVPISVIAYTSVDEIRLRNLLKELGAEVTMTWTMPVTAEAKLDASLIPKLARSPEVLNIFWSPEKEPADWASGEIHHFHDAWMPLRSGIPRNLTGHSPGPDGIQGNADDIFEIVGIQDTGLDLNNDNSGQTDLFYGPLGDRVIRLTRRVVQCNQPDGRFDGFGHGTVVAGTVLSNGYAWESEYGHPVDDFIWDESEAGVVPEGMLSFDCVGPSLSITPTYWDDEYADGAKTFSNSFGSPTTVYGSIAIAVDYRTNESNDKMFLFATLNNGPYPDTVSGMSKGKNGLSIGATQNYRPDQSEADTPNLMASFSSRGNPGERFKPDLVTIGTSVVTWLSYGEWLALQGSPKSDYIKYVDANNDGIPEYKYYSGTSVATPNAAGLYMLTREYFREIHGIDNVNSQLAKALLINGAVRMDPNLYDYPGIDQGWGRMDIEQSLFPPAPRSNQWEEGSFATTGTWTPATINTNVMSSEIPLKVTLVWIDAPGEALVRDLDLIVRDPTGAYEYHGNQYADMGSLRGWTDPSDIDYDNINNVEQVEVQFPISGTWTVEVKGVSIPSTANFALVFSADVGPMKDYQVSLSTDYVTTLEVAPGGTASFPFDVRSFSINSDIITISHDTPTQFSVLLDWTNEPFSPLETKFNFVMFTAASSASAGSYPILMCGISQNDTTVPPTSDCISIKIIVIEKELPPRWDVTYDSGQEMDPSILTFTRGGINHVFVAYRKITPVNYSDKTRGGSNVWVAHNTINQSHMPNATWTHQSVSDINDNPTNLRMLYIDNGTFEGRVVITWSGLDPSELVPENQPWGRIAFTDPPYSNWTLRTIQKNYGTNVFNRVRASFPAFRMAGGPNGTLVWVWEHLDSPSAPTTSISAIQTHTTFSFDGGNSWSDCKAVPSECYFVAPRGSTNYYFFPNGVVDQNEVLWIFFYWMPPVANPGRRVAVSLWDGPIWDSGWTLPINVWDLGDTKNIEYPIAISTPEGGNRVYVAATMDNGTVWTKHIYITFAEGNFGSGIVGPPPEPVMTGNVSANFSQPQGPIGNPVLFTRYNEGPVLNIVYTDDGLVWVPYEEEKEMLGGRSDLSTWSSPDGFANRSLMNVTEDTYGKGSARADTLTIGTKSCVYGVWHKSSASFEKANYNIYLTIYCADWPPANDTVGPIVQSPTTIPNPFEKTFSSSLKVFAQLSDVYTGYSNITSAELVLTDTMVNDPLAVNWTDAWVMNLTGVDASPTETAWLWANETAINWSTGSCHRFWIRGQDSRGNWGIGAYVDVCVSQIPFIPWVSVMKKAELTGLGFSDVTLTWAKSLDDGSGKNIVTKYKVARSEQITGPFIVIANVSATGASEYSWTDVGAGHGNFRQFFYHVIANSTLRDSPPSKLAGKFYRTMDGGKQLVSIPLVQANGDPIVVFQTVNYVYARTYVAGTPSPWWSHKSGRLINSLTSLNPQQGYWIEMNGPGTMTVAGLVTENVIMGLKSGWNLIGFPSFNNSYTFADLDTDIGGSLQLVEIYDLDAGPYYLQEIHRNAWSATYMLPGYAYMIRVSNDVSWCVPNI